MPPKKNIYGKKGKTDEVTDAVYSQMTSAYKAQHQELIDDTKKEMNDNVRQKMLNRPPASEKDIKRYISEQLNYIKTYKKNPLMIRSGFDNKILHSKGVHYNNTPSPNEINAVYNSIKNTIPTEEQRWQQEFEEKRLDRLRQFENASYQSEGYDSEGYDSEGYQSDGYDHAEEGRKEEADEKERIEQYEKDKVEFEKQLQIDEDKKVFATIAADNKRKRDNEQKTNTQSRKELMRKRMRAKNAASMLPAPAEKVSSILPVPSITYKKAIEMNNSGKSYIGESSKHHNTFYICDHENKICDWITATQEERLNLKRLKMVTRDEATIMVNNDSANMSVHASKKNKNNSYVYNNTTNQSNWIRGGNTRKTRNIGGKTRKTRNIGGKTRKTNKTQNKGKKQRKFTRGKK